jgi:glucokinase
MPRVYLQKLREQIAVYAIPELLAGVKFSVAKLGGEAVAVGAVSWMRNVKH